MSFSDIVQITKKEIKISKESEYALKVINFLGLVSCEELKRLRIRRKAINELLSKDLIFRVRIGNRTYYGITTLGKVIITNND